MLSPRAVLSILVLAASALADPAPADGPPPGGAPAPKVLDPGRAPLRALRLRPRTGDRQELKITMRMSLGMAFADLPAAMRELPSIVLPFTVTVREVRAGGDIETEFRCGRVEVTAAPGTDPMMVDMMRTICAGVEGVSGRSLLNARGITLESKLSIPENMDPGSKVVLAGMREAVGQISFPLPEEPVGVGAKWEVVSHLAAEDGAPEQRTTYTLTALDGDRFTVSAESVTRAGEGMIQMLPGQAPLKRRSLDSRGSAVIRGEFTRVAPAETTVESAIVERIEVRPNTVMTRRTSVRSEVRQTPVSSRPGADR